MEEAIWEQLNPVESDVGISDIDSLVVCSHTLEPFRCDVVSQVDGRPSKVMRSRNTKLTTYLSKRQNELYSDGQWYDFQLGHIDFRPIYVLFQLDPNCAFFSGVPICSTRDKEGRLRAACKGFMREIIVRAARGLDRDTETARGGLCYVDYDVARSYNIMRVDFPHFAQLLSDVLRSNSLLQLCGMTCARFYFAIHGVRLGNFAAHSLLMNVVSDADHPHLDVMQIHRQANVLNFDNTSKNRRCTLFTVD